MTAPDPTRLGGVGEIAEDEATGAVASGYAQIRALLGVPFVPTIYRMVAVREDLFLEAIARLTPVIAAQRDEAFVPRLEAVARQALSPTAAGGLGELDRETSLLVERYSAVNPLGLLFVVGLVGTDIEWIPSVMAPPLPARTDDIFADIRQCYGGAIVPGFWRELGKRPEVLLSVWSTTRAHADEGGFEAASRAVFDVGVDTVRRAGGGTTLHDRAPAEAEEMRRMVGWFPTGISNMIAVTEWFRSADQR